MGVPAQKIFLVIADLGSVFFFSGIAYGWAPLHDILRSEGFYKHLCGEGDEGCDAQEAALNTAFTVATSAVAFVALPAGAFVDKFGPMWGTMVAGTLNILGLVGLALSKHGSEGFDLFLYSFVLMAVGGSVTMFCGYSLPFCFPERANLFIELNSCLFDASCIIFSGFKVLYDSGATFEGLFWGYTIFCIFTFVSVISAWAMNSKKVSETQSNAHVEDEPDTNPMHNLPISKMLLTFEYWAMFIFAIIQVPRSNLYLGVVNLINEDIGKKAGMSESALSTLTIVVGLIIPQGWCAVPLIEMCIHHMGILGTVQVTSIIGILYNVLQMVPSVAVQIVAAIIFAAFRAFLFSMITAYFADMFGFKVLGRLMGTSFLAGGVINFLQAPLVAASLGNFTALNIGTIVVCIPLMLIMALVQKKHAQTSHTDDALMPNSVVRTRSYAHSGAAGGGSAAVVMERMLSSASRTASNGGAREVLHQ